ncbi:hypothetical protein ACWGA9_06175 [Streptomyces sp. NPDC054950]
MGEHSAPESSWASRLAWLVENRKKIVAGLVVILPLASRYVPGFPTDEVLSVLRVFLGA